MTMPEKPNLSPVGTDGDIPSKGGMPNKITMTIEYRVRPVTRYVLTKSRIRSSKANSPDGTVSEVGEFQSLSTANTVGAALAAKEPYEGADDVSVTFEGFTPPGEKVRAKFRCSAIMPATYKESGSVVHMNAVWGGASEDGGNAALENRIFSKATPNATLQMEIRNEAALAKFVVGQEYYLDFTPANKD